MKKKNCYCNQRDSNPEILKPGNIPKGYCGLCEICGKPGHIRHFPGPVPYTGAWCDFHYYHVMFLHPKGEYRFLVETISWLFLIVAAIAILIWLL